MDGIQMMCWLYGGQSECESAARHFFGKLRDGTAGGHPFPFPCPYRVQLLRNTAATEWVVAVQVMRGSPGDDSSEQVRELYKWFEACGVSRKDAHDRVWKWVRGGTMRSTLQGLSYAYLESFGNLKGD
jgi:hypothetical protein